MAKPQLTYFDGVGGRAEPIRLVLKIAGVDFEDEKISMAALNDPDSDYAQRKVAGEFCPLAVSGGGLPVYKEYMTEDRSESKTRYETNAVLRYLGARHGFYSSDPAVMWEIDMVLEKVECGFNHAGIAQHSYYCFGCIEAAEGREGPTDEVTANCFTLYEDLCNFGEAQLTSHGKAFLAGTDSATIADFRFIVQFSDSIYNDESSVMAVEMKTRVKELIDTKPNLKAWIETSMLPLIKDVRTPGLMW